MKSTIGLQHVTKMQLPRHAEPYVKHIREGDIGWHRCSIVAKELVQQEFPEDADKLVFFGTDERCNGKMIETQWSWKWS